MFSFHTPQLDPSKFLVTIKVRPFIDSDFKNAKKEKLNLSNSV